MSNRASGFVCPVCASVGEHVVLHLWPGVSILLHCMTCETSFEDVLD